MEWPCRLFFLQYLFQPGYERVCHIHRLDSVPLGGRIPTLDDAEGFVDPFDDRYRIEKFHNLFVQFQLTVDNEDRVIES